MNHSSLKTVRFWWRLARNLACVLPVGRRLLFPGSKLASRFGRGDAEYSWSVFQHHHDLLVASGFTEARSLLEVGPGRNLGTGLLWWARLHDASPEGTRVTCWDVFPNAEPSSPGFWADLAAALLDAGGDGLARFPDIRKNLEAVNSGAALPGVEYRVSSAADHEARVAREAPRFDLVYSHAALEHVWGIRELWASLARMTAVGGWHSHRIDLADHGRRETNPVEMLEWSPLAYWLTARFIPGAINRWRACEHLAVMAENGLRAIDTRYALIDRLPVPLNRIALPYRTFEERELRAVAVDVIARK